MPKPHILGRPVLNSFIRKNVLWRQILYFIHHCKISANTWQLTLKSNEISHTSEYYTEIAFIGFKELGKLINDDRSQKTIVFSGWWINWNGEWGNILGWWKYEVIYWSLGNIILSKFINFICKTCEFHCIKNLLQQNKYYDQCLSNNVPWNHNIT